MATTATSSSETVTVHSQDECTVTSVAGSTVETAAAQLDECTGSSIAGSTVETAAAQLDECTGSSVAGSKGMEAAAAQLDECTGSSVAGSTVETAAAQLDECTGSSIAGSKGMEAAAAQLRGELLHLRPGDYTLASDQDPSVGETDLHLLLHFCCEGQLVCWCDGSVVCDRVFSLSLCVGVCRVVRGLWRYACVRGKR